MPTTRFEIRVNNDDLPLAIDYIQDYLSSLKCLRNFAVSDDGSVITWELKWSRLRRLREIVKVLITGKPEPCLDPLRGIVDLLVGEGMAVEYWEE